MAKPRLIILIRHAQSEGNKNREIHQTIPDHRVKLTPEGWQQAYEAGRRLRAMLRADDTIHFFTSPYRRTRETTEGILATLTSDEPEPSPFKRNNIKVYEEPRLREQDFGNFQPCSAEMERMWQERADYGHFFYRIPNGESAADAYDRISGFNESLWRQFGEDDFASICVLVTHGLMSRVFLMKWYHFSVEYFEDLRNVNHCEFLIMRKQDNGKYKLENKLRTWSELRRERALQAAREKGEKGEAKEKACGKEIGHSKDGFKLDRTHLSRIPSVVETRRRWGGCPDGCNHDKNFRIRQTLADLVQSDSSTCSRTNITANFGASRTVGDVSTKLSATVSVGATGNGGDLSDLTTSAGANGPLAAKGDVINSPNAGIGTRRLAAKRFQPGSDDTSSVVGPQIDVTKALGDDDSEGAISSADGTPSFISIEDRLRGQLLSPNVPLHVGRDFGGTYSGHSSVAASDADSSEDETLQHGDLANDGFKAASRAGSESLALPPLCHHRLEDVHHRHETQPHHGHRRDHSGMGRGSRANRLGDAPHSSDGEHDQEADHGNDEHEKELVPSRKGDNIPDECETADLQEKSVQGSVF
ncbi:hypothetical protein VTK73DRAFT_10014 [Phialemonium thermophilum]|uniref:Broad-range acid phosphatase DET1 n=1 Tax=Phialemonium thermophilum TaxID=223376 RepID=A0ABR3Y452_9PEZI